MVRSTGCRSLNSHIHGHCEDIASQAGVPKALVYQVVCLEALEADIIHLVQVLDRMVPQHESQWTSTQAAEVVTLCHKMADERRYWLTEYIDYKPTRVWYGRDKRPEEEA